MANICIEKLVESSRYVRDVAYEGFADVNPRLVQLTMELVGRNDPGHSWRHITQVALDGHMLATRHGLDTLPFALAAMCHDMFSWQDRESHNTLAGAWVRQHLGDYGYAGILELVAQMCEQHRNSGPRVYSSLYSELFAAADVGEPDPVKTALRSYGYARGKLGKGHQEACIHVVGLFGRYRPGGDYVWKEHVIRAFPGKATVVNQVALAITPDMVDQIVRISGIY